MSAPTDYGTKYRQSLHKATDLVRMVRTLPCYNDPLVQLLCERLTDLQEDADRLEDDLAITREEATMDHRRVVHYMQKLDQLVERMGNALTHPPTCGD